MGWGLAGGYDWNFKVNPDCSVEFLGNGPSWGHDTLPDPVNCNILKIPNSIVSTEVVEIYPNPTYGPVTITTSENLFSGCLSILNLNGQNLISHILTENKIQIDIRSLPAGIYIARLSDETGVKVGKIVKW